MKITMARVAGHMVPPHRREEIANLAWVLRKHIGYSKRNFFPIVEFFEQILPILVPEFEQEILSNDQMGGKHGETFPQQSRIVLSEEVYDRAVAGEGRDRLTIAHECGHLLMLRGVNPSYCRTDDNHPIYCDSEWQADVFGGALLAPGRMLRGKDEETVSEEFGVSLAAAQAQLDHARKCRFAY